MLTDAHRSPIISLVKFHQMLGNFLFLTSVQTDPLFFHDFLWPLPQTLRRRRTDSNISMKEEHHCQAQRTYESVVNVKVVCCPLKL